MIAVLLAVVVVVYSLLLGQALASLLGGRLVLLPGTAAARIKRPRVWGLGRVLFIAAFGLISLMPRLHSPAGDRVFGAAIAVLLASVLCEVTARFTRSRAPQEPGAWPVPAVCGSVRSASAHADAIVARQGGGTVDGVEVQDSPCR